MHLAKLSSLIEKGQSPADALVEGCPRKARRAAARSWRALASRATLAECVLARDVEGSSHEGRACGLAPENASPALA